MKTLEIGQKRCGICCRDEKKIWLLMNLLDKFRYSKDDPGQLSINLENYAEKKNIKVMKIYLNSFQTQ